MKERKNLQADVAEALLGVGDGESTVSLGADFSSLKLLDAVNEAIRSPSFLGCDYSPSAARPWAHSYSPPTIHIFLFLFCIQLSSAQNPATAKTQ